MIPRNTFGSPSTASSSASPSAFPTSSYPLSLTPPAPFPAALVATRPAKTTNTNAPTLSHSPASTSTSPKNDPNGWRPSPVYTFLATLVLLLSVSAAIVVRSFILRRRHRLMVEEAIRNGTWNPGMMDGGVGGNGPLGRGGNRVDLSKKPRMWDTYVGNVPYSDQGGSIEKEPTTTGGYHGRGGGLIYTEARDWDGIKPISVAYVPATPASPSKSGAASSTSLSAPGTSQLAGVPQHLQPPATRGILRDAGTFVADLFRSPRPFPPPMTPQNAVQGWRTSEDGDGVEMTGMGKDEGGEKTVRVAVLIAMPRPPSAGSQRPSALTSGSGEGEGSSSDPLSGGSRSITGKSDRDGEEEEAPLPVLEIGVAEVLVVDNESEDGRRRVSEDSVVLKKGGDLERGQGVPERGV